MLNVDSNLIRAYVDGELSPDVAEQVRHHIETHPEARAQVEFDSRLRAGVRKAMAAPAAPAALAESIRASLEAEAAMAGVEPSQNEPAPAAPSVSPGWIAAISAMIAQITRPRPISASAVLAVIVLVGTAVVIGIFAPQIDTMSPSPRAETVADPAEFASQEHDRCVRDPEHLLEKINFCSPHEAALALREHFGVDGLTVFDLSASGYEFLGESRCGIPGSRQSAHLLYERRMDGDRTAMVSIFIATARGNGCPKTGCGRELQPGEWHRSRQGSPCRKRVLQSTDSALVYYLVGCDEADAGAIAELVSESLLAKSR